MKPNIRNRSIITVALLALTLIVPNASQAVLSDADKAMWAGAVKGLEAGGTNPDERAKIALIQDMVAAAASGTAIQKAAELNAKIDALSITQRNKEVRHGLVNTILAQDNSFVPPNNPPDQPGSVIASKYAAPALVIGELHIRNVSGFPAGRTDIPGYGSFNNVNKFALIPAKTAGLTATEADAALDRNLGNGDWLDGSGANSVPLSISDGKPDGTEVGTKFLRFYITRYEDSNDQIGVLESDGAGGPEAVALKGKDYVTFGDMRWTDSGRPVLFQWYQSTSEFKPSVKGDDDFIRPIVIPATN